MTGQEIVDEIMMSHHVGPKDFYSRTRFPHAVRARRAAINALKAAGFNNAATARLLRRHVTTIRYWIKPERRAKRKVQGLAYWHTYLSPTRTTYL